MGLDAFLPRYDVRDVHSIAIEASPERVMSVARELKGRDVPLLTVLVALRSLPKLLERPPPLALPADRRRVHPGGLRAAGRAPR